MRALALPIGLDGVGLHERHALLIERSPECSEDGLHLAVNSVGTIGETRDREQVVGLALMDHLGRVKRLLDEAWGTRVTTTSEWSCLTRLGVKANDLACPLTGDTSQAE